MPKVWWKSKTVWFNVVTVLLSLTGGLPALFPMIEPMVAPQVYSYMLFGVGVVNVFLRGLTKNGIVAKA